MEFKKLNLRATILLGIAGMMILGAVIARFRADVTPIKAPEQILPMAPVMRKPVKSITEEDSQTLKDLKEQMDADRLQQKKIKSLKLQLEQANLQLEQAKALSEIGKLQKESTGIVNDSTDGGQGKYPVVKVIYIGKAGENKEAILSINGESYSVKEKNIPVKNMQVTTISDTGVTLHFSQPQDLITTIDYKPE